ncbi:MAG TPA: DUF2490 domain-containing protein [bacterium]|nr:DUF2490 domain-containing protein [bacterium]
MNSIATFSKCCSLALGIVLMIVSPRASASDNDWQNWSSISVTTFMTDTVTFIAKPEFRFDDDISRHYYTHMEFGVAWKVTSWLTLSPCYRHVNQKKSDTWQVEYRPHLNATLGWKLGVLSFKNRSRLEYRIRDSRETFRYTNKFSVQFPEYHSIRTYVAVEPFYDFDASEWNKNRVFAGFDFRVFRHMKAGLEYVFESTKQNSDWTNSHVIGTSLAFTF